MADHFDLVASKAARDDALAKVSDHAGEWMDTAYAALLTIRIGTELTGEDVRRRLSEMGCPLPHHHNAWGALIRSAIRRRVLRDTGRLVHMRSVRSHGRRTALYVRQIDHSLFD